METIYYIKVPSSDLSFHNKEEWPSECNGAIVEGGYTTFTIHSEKDKNSVESQLEEREILYTTTSVNIDEDGGIYF